MTDHPDYYRNEFSTAEGPIVLWFPKKLSAESFKYLPEWLGLVQHAIGHIVECNEQRAKTVTPPSPPAGDAQNGE